MCARRRDVLAAETVEERETRLQQMRAHRHYVLAAETVEEREAWLQLRIDRLAAESAVQRNDRLQRDRDRHRQLQAVQSRLPLFDQQSAGKQMLKFRAPCLT